MESLSLLIVLRISEFCLNGECPMMHCIQITGSFCLQRFMTHSAIKDASCLWWAEKVGRPFRAQAAKPSVSLIGRGARHYDISCLRCDEFSFSQSLRLVHWFD